RRPTGCAPRASPTWSPRPAGRASSSRAWPMPTAPVAAWRTRTGRSGPTAPAVPSRRRRPGRARAAGAGGRRERAAFRPPLRSGHLVRARRLVRRPGGGGQGADRGRRRVGLLVHARARRGHRGRRGPRQAGRRRAQHRGRRPGPAREWLPELARRLDAPAPRRVPVALARLAVGGWGVAFMSRLAGADNRRARLHLDWRPGFPSWRDGFAAELGVATG